MSLVFAAFGAMIGYSVAVIVAQNFGITGAIVWGIGLPAAVLGYIAWDYSPLPNSNGGPMNIDPNTGWGWSDE